MDASAVQFCARKVSAVSGDARKALDICRWGLESGHCVETGKAGVSASGVSLGFLSRRAVEVVESDERKKESAQRDDPKGEFRSG